MSALLGHLPVSLHVSYIFAVTTAAVPGLWIHKVDAVVSSEPPVQVISKGSIKLLPCEGSPQCNASAECEQGDPQRNASCAANHTGYLCAQCEPGFAKSAKRRCIPCNNVHWSTVFASIGTMVVMGVGMLLQSLSTVCPAAQAEEIFTQVDMDGNGEYRLVASPWVSCYCSWLAVAKFCAIDRESRQR